MVLSDHGNYSGVVDIARNGIDEVIRLKAQANPGRWLRRVVRSEMTSGHRACRWSTR